MGQPEILAYINGCGRAVTVEELRIKFNRTQGSVSRCIKQLQRYNLIRVTMIGQKKIITMRDCL